MNRIAFLTDELNSLASTGECRRFVAALRARGHAVQLIHSSCSEQRERDAIHIPAKRQGRFGMDSLRLIRRCLRDFSCDQVICQGPRSIGAGPWVSAGQAATLTAIHTSTEQLLNQFLNWSQRVTLSRFDEHLVRHSADLESLRQRFPAWNLGTLDWTRPDHLWPSSAAEIKRQLNIPANAKIVGTATDLVQHNRVKDFVWAGDLMRCIRDDVYWLVLGDGAQQWRLRRFTRQLDVGDNVRFLGLPENAEQIVASLDVYVQPATWDQACVGLAFASAHGIPRVGIIDPLHRRFIQHGRNGFLVERGARNEISRCVNRLVNEPAIAKQFSLGTRELADELLCEASQLPLGDGLAADKSRAVA